MSELVTALFAIEESHGTIHVVPAGRFVTTRDDRSFQVSDPAAVCRRSETPLLIDYEHSSEAWQGSTRAAGWLEELFAESDGSIHGRVKFTPDGERDVRTKAYRYVSPVLVLNDDRDVQEIVSIALTNRPALRLSPISAFRQRQQELRIACSLRTPATSAPAFVPLTQTERASMRRRGTSDQDLDHYDAFKRRQHEAFYAGGDGLHSATTPDWNAGALANVARFKRERGIE